jgi:hypothetical protein
VSDKRTFHLVHGEARRRAMSAVAEAQEGYCVTVQPPKRSLSQNALMWPLLERFSQQLVWPVNGQMVKLEPDEWKDVLTAAFKGETVRLAMGLNGGVVMLGMRTSEMPKAQFSDFVEFVFATAAARGVELEKQEA